MARIGDLSTPRWLDVGRVPLLAIQRGDGEAVVPTAQEVLREGDVLALAGTHEAIDAARAVLETPRSQEAAAP